MSSDPADDSAEMEVFKAMQAQEKQLYDGEGLVETLNNNHAPPIHSTFVSPKQEPDPNSPSTLPESPLGASSDDSFSSSAASDLPLSTSEYGVLPKSTAVSGVVPQESLASRPDSRALAPDIILDQGPTELSITSPFSEEQHSGSKSHDIDHAALSEQADTTNIPPARISVGVDEYLVPHTEQGLNTEDQKLPGEHHSVPFQPDASPVIVEKHPPSAVTASIGPVISSQTNGPTTRSMPESDGSGANVVNNSSSAVPRSRLAHDTVGILEDRIREDPKGDLTAWTELVQEHQKRDRYEDARAVFERSLKLFPTAAELWVAYAQMELQANDFAKVENIFTRALLSVPKVEFWSLYLDYVRRRNNLTTDQSGKARTTITLAYDFVLSTVGIDYESGPLWRDYLNFIKDGPGVVGGSNWQDQQKMDLLRKAYQRAICLPVQGVDQFWKEYDGFEMGLNKQTGRKFLQERSPAYMTARGAFLRYSNDFRGLDRSTLPKLPPVPGFDGYEEYQRQVSLWKDWIAWEKEDPLVLKDDEPSAYRTRISFVYKQAVMSLRFWPPIWVEAADWCFENGNPDEGLDFLKRAIIANPESVLLTLRLAERIELTLARADGEDEIKRQGLTVRAPYDVLLNHLYEHLEKHKARQATLAVGLSTDSPTAGAKIDGADQAISEENQRSVSTPDQDRMKQQRQVTETVEAHTRLICRVITFVWIALMRAMRRVQGKGNVGSEIGGCRQVFADARKRGRVTSEIYVASALIEWHCYRDPAGTKIFERGMKLWPTDGPFAVEYLKHLISLNDITNARVVFETSVAKLGLEAARPVYSLFHSFESNFGDLSQIRSIEERMSKLYLSDPTLQHFKNRFSNPDFDPTSVQLLVSPAVQMRPIVRTNGAQVTEQNSEHGHLSVDSPKRSYPADLSDREDERPRKIARSDSPLKGAAGKRVEQLKRARPAQDSTPPTRSPTNRTVTHQQTISSFAHCHQLSRLVRELPRSELYNLPRFNAERVRGFIQGSNLSPVSSMGQKRT